MCNNWIRPERTRSELFATILRQRLTIKHNFHAAISLNGYREFRSNFENVSRDCRMTVVWSFSFIFIRTTVARHSWVSHLKTFVWMLLSFYVFSRLSRNCRMTFVRVLRNFRIVNLPKFCGDMFATLAWKSYDHPMTVLQYILAKKIFYICLRGLSQKYVDICDKTRMCMQNCMKFIWSLCIHLINISYKYGWIGPLHNSYMHLCQEG